RHTQTEQWCGRQSCSFAGGKLPVEQVGDNLRQCPLAFTLAFPVNLIMRDDERETRSFQQDFACQIPRERLREFPAAEEHNRVAAACIDYLSGVPLDPIDLELVLEPASYWVYNVVLFFGNAHHFTQRPLARRQPHEFRSADVLLQAVAAEDIRLNAGCIH